MILWTVQPVEVYEKILETGKYVCDGRRTDKFFRDRYKWLCEEMKIKIGKLIKVVGVAFIVVVASNPNV